MQRAACSRGARSSGAPTRTPFFWRVLPPLDRVVHRRIRGSKIAFLASMPRDTSDAAVLPRGGCRHGWHERHDAAGPHDAGLMLIDAIIATAILAGAVIAAARIITDASSLNVAAGQTTLSASLAAGTLERLRARDTLLPGESGSEAVLPGGGFPAGDQRHLAYTVRWTAAALPNPSLVRVTVSAHAGEWRVVRSASLMTVRRSNRQ